MCQQLLGDAAFYRLLLRLDEDLAAAERPLGCRVCGKRLEVCDFRRKPRGLAIELGERFAERLSFCCAERSCRKPCGASPVRMRRLHELVGVSRHTVARWRQWWSEGLPATRFWAGLAGTLMPPVAVADLPASLLARFAGPPDEQLLSLLRALAAQRRQPRRARCLAGRASPAEDARRATPAAAITVRASARGTGMRA